MSYLCSMKKLVSYDVYRKHASEGRKQEQHRCRMCQVVFFICLSVSLALIIGGFFMPPMGVIDGSVLTAVGELIVFPALAFGMRAVELGYDLRLSHGSTSMEISNDNNDTDNEQEEGDMDPGHPVRPDIGAGRIPGC